VPSSLDDLIHMLPPQCHKSWYMPTYRLPNIFSLPMSSASLPSPPSSSSFNLAMAGKWKTLSIDSPSLPRLLVKASLDLTGYTIHLTDLSRTWSESLTRKQLVHRAINDDCSIDPTEGHDQTRILLEKIGQALDQQDGTSLALEATKDDGLGLNLTSPLPAPLPVFKWIVHLKLEPPQAIQKEVIDPLLHHAQSQQSLIRALVHEIHEKDRVISKITDRLEQSGNDLTTVFPGASSIKTTKKKSQREQLAKHVRGLGDFDEKEWMSKHDDTDGHGPLQVEVLNDVMRGLPASCEVDDGTSREWWRNVEHSAIASSKPKDSAKASQVSGVDDSIAKDAHGAGDDDGDATMVDAEDAEFQRQATPPQLRRHTEERSQQRQETQLVESSFVQERQPEPPQHDDESTEEEEDDLDAPPRPAIKSQTAAKAPPARQRTATLDTVASSPRSFNTTSKKRKSTSPAPTKTWPPKAASPAPTPQKTRPRLGVIGGNKSSKKSATPESSAADAKAPTATKPCAKLGVIGGKKKTQPEPALDQEPESATTVGRSSSPPPKHRLGRIGGGRSKDSGTANTAPSSSATTNDEAAQKDEDLPRRARTVEKKKEPAPPPAPRETSRERADRRREELRKELDEKAKQPAKKKRRF
jgi:hypothetical protein